MLNDGWNNPWKQSRSPSPSWWTKLADGSLPHNHHKPQLAGYELGGSK